VKKISCEGSALKTPQQLLKSGYVLVAVTLGVLSATPSLAQTVSNPIQDLQNGNSNDVGNILNGNTGTGAASIMNLMNRIQTMDGRSPDEYSADQRENINNAAEAFRQRQQQRIESNPANPGAVAPAPVTPK
jgi:hypothetical protein